MGLYFHTFIYSVKRNEKLPSVYYVSEFTSKKSICSFLNESKKGGGSSSTACIPFCKFRTIFLTRLSY